MTTPSRTATAGTLRLPSRARAVPTSTRLATRRAPAVAVLLLALLLGGGVVVSAQAAGWWATTGRDALGTAAGTETPGGSGGGGSGALPADPADVKGWMTLEQVLAAGFPGVTEAGLRARFAIPADVALDTPLKELDGVVPGFDMTALRDWLAAQG